MWIDHCKEIQKLTFRALALRWCESISFPVFCLAWNAKIIVSHAHLSSSLTLAPGLSITAVIQNSYLQLSMFDGYVLCTVVHTTHPKRNKFDMGVKMKSTLVNFKKINGSQKSLLWHLLWTLCWKTALYFQTYGFVLVLPEHIILLLYLIWRSKEWMLILYAVMCFNRASEKYNCVQFTGCVSWRGVVGSF